MNTEIINKLFCEKNRLSNYVQNFYERFISFKESKKPQILMVSSNNRLKVGIDNYIDKSNDEYDIKSYTPETLQNQYDDVIFSDCIIIYTSALQVSPQNIYEVCEFAAQFHKSTYVLLGGWNSMTCTPEKVAKKIEEVQTNLHFMDFINIFAVRKQVNCDAVLEFDEAIKKTIDNILLKFEFTRNDQENIIYNYAKNIVEKELDELDNNLYKDIKRVLDFKSSILSKKSGYIIELKNASVPLTNIAQDVYSFCIDKLPHSYSNYFTYEEYESKSLEELSETVKTKISTKVKEYFKDYKNEPKKTVDAKLKNLESSCTQELNELTAPLSHVNSILEEDLSKIKSDINDINILSDYSKYISDVYKSEITSLENTVIDKINMIQLDFDKIRNKEKLHDSLIEFKNQIKPFIDTLKSKNKKNEKAKDENDTDESTADENETDTEKSLSEDTQIEDTQIEDTNTEDKQPEDTNTEDKQTEDTKSDKEQTQKLQEIGNVITIKNKINPQDFCDFFIQQVAFISTNYSNDLMNTANTKIKESSRNYMNNYFAKILYSIDDIINKLTKIQESVRNSI